MKRTFDELREEYLHASLTESELSDGPLELFHHWFAQAVEEELPLANAMALATVGEGGRPSMRMVLLKAFDRAGATFFTNYGSRKGQELAQNQYASLLFWWSALERQIRVAGRCERVSAAESDEYFDSRPRGSNIGAMVSNQSTELASRRELEDAVARLERESAGAALTRPETWGGFRLIPDRFEFWQGRENRLHDRFEYNLGPSGAWTWRRLAP